MIFLSVNSKKMEFIDHKATEDPSENDDLSENKKHWCSQMKKVRKMRWRIL